MDKIVTSELARQIASNLVAETWGWWLLAVVVWITATATAAYLKPYTTKVAELDALQENMQKVLDQLEQTTTLTKRIEKQIDHEDWTAREWKTVRRLKLEEMLDLVDGIIYWASELSTHAKEEQLNTSIFKIHSLGLLYFPELEDPVYGLVNRSLAFHAAVTRFAKSKSESIEQRESYRAQGEDLLGQLMDSVKIIRNEAKALIVRIAGPNNSNAFT